MCHKSWILHLCPWVAKDCGALSAFIQPLGVHPWLLSQMFLGGLGSSRRIRNRHQTSRSDGDDSHIQSIGTSSLFWDTHQLNTECTHSVLGIRDIEWESFAQKIQTEVHCKSPLLSCSQCTTLMSYRSQKLCCFVSFYVYFPRVSTLINLNTSQPHSVVIFLQTELSAI